MNVLKIALISATAMAFAAPTFAQTAAVPQPAVAAPTPAGTTLTVETGKSSPAKVETKVETKTDAKLDTKIDADGKTTVATVTKSNDTKTTTSPAKDVKHHKKAAAKPVSAPAVAPVPEKKS